MAGHLLSSERQQRGNHVVAGQRRRLLLWSRGPPGRGGRKVAAGSRTQATPRRPAEISQQLPPEVQTPATGNASRGGRLAGPSGWQGGPGGGALPVWGSGGYPPVREPSRSG